MFYNLSHSGKCCIHDPKPGVSVGLHAQDPHAPLAHGVLQNCLLVVELHIALQDVLHNPSAEPRNQHTEGLHTDQGMGCGWPADAHIHESLAHALQNARLSARLSADGGVHGCGDGVVVIRDAHSDGVVVIRGARDGNDDAPYDDPSESIVQI